MPAETEAHGTYGYDPDHDPSMRRRKRPFLVVAISVSLVAAFAATAVYSYRLGYRAGSSRVTPIIMADGGPIKVRPDDPGGMRVPDQDKRIFGRLAPGKGTGSDTGREVFTEAGERPIESLLMTVRPSAGTPPPAAPRVVPPTEDALPPKVALPPPPPPMKTPPRPPAGPVVVKELTPRSAAGKDAEQPRPAPAPERPPPAAKPTQRVAAVPKAAASPAPPRDAKSGSYLVQLSSTRSVEDARRRWAALRRGHPELFAGLSESIARADLGAGKGIWYRLRTGPFDSREAAKRMCGRASKRKIACFVVRR